MLDIRHVYVPGEGSPQEQLDRDMKALGYFRSGSAIETARFGLSEESRLSSDKLDKADSPTALMLDPEAFLGGSEPVAATDEGTLVWVPVGPTAELMPKRERGKASPGHTRRTKAEMAEDAAADAADAANGVVFTNTQRLGEPLDGRTLEAGDPRNAPQITANPENRVGPQDSPEVQAQDAADERAETEANRAANGGGLTLDDVRNAYARYYAKYGMAGAVKDIRDAMACELIAIPTDQESLAKAIALVDEMTANNPMGRPIVGTVDEAPAATGPTLDNLKAVMGRYVRAYGKDEAFEDLPKVLGVASVLDLAQNPVVYAAKMAAVEQAISANPFGRKAAT